LTQTGFLWVQMPVDLLVHRVLTLGLESTDDVDLPLSQSKTKPQRLPLFVALQRLEKSADVGKNRPHAIRAKMIEWVTTSRN
jgi:hypothetical protein